MNGKNNLTGINKWEFLHASPLPLPSRSSPAGFQKLVAGKKTYPRFVDLSSRSSQGI